MLVYGDPKSNQPATVWIRATSQHLAEGGDSIDRLRSALILAGQLEQALADGAAKDSGEADHLRLAAQVTEGVAALLVRRWLGGSYWDSGQGESASRRLRSQLQALDTWMGKHRLTAKIPEGFAFYGLYPEQYCAAALDWHKASNGDAALVIGIRSVGTTLSAVVQETLRTIGVDAQRVTVRPGGPPFERSVSLRISSGDRVREALIVDEGPGLSGSSMAAVAKACAQAGLSRICFLPGHSGLPGPMANTRVKEIWQRTPRYVVGLEKLTFERRSITRALIDKAEELTGNRFEVVEDLSAGGWRQAVFGDRPDWPASSGLFERMKFRCAGDGRSVLWKFAGLHSIEGTDAVEVALRQWALRAHRGFSPAPLGAFRGFMGRPWIDGEPLAKPDAAKPNVLRRIASYILDAARPPLTEAMQRDAVQRLDEMLFWNTREAAGEAMAQFTRGLVSGAQAVASSMAYGDGHMAPHEWIRTAAGQVMKVDCEYHGHDHTLVGAQSVLWDVAGVLIEWDLSQEATEDLLELIEAGGMRVEGPALKFYQAAYAAFKLGLIAMGLQTDDGAEKIRRQAAYNFYRGKLFELVKAEAVPGAR